MVGAKSFQLTLLTIYVLIYWSMNVLTLYC